MGSGCTPSPEDRTPRRGEQRQAGGATALPHSLPATTRWWEPPPSQGLSVPVARGARAPREPGVRASGALLPGPSCAESEAHTACAMMWECRCATLGKACQCKLPSGPLAVGGLWEEGSVGSRQPQRGPGSFVSQPVRVHAQSTPSPRRGPRVDAVRPLLGERRSFAADAETGGAVIALGT